MNRWYGMAVLALALTSAAFADSAPKILPIDTPVIVIHADRHSHQVQRFESASNKNSFWRTEIGKKGYDVAYTEWMRADHPWEFVAVCTKAAAKVKMNSEHTSHMSEFIGAQSKDSTLRASVQAVGSDAAFLDWLRTHHPDSYKTELAKVGLSDSSSKWSHKSGHK